MHHNSARRGGERWEGDKLDRDPATPAASRRTGGQPGPPAGAVPAPHVAAAPGLPGAARPAPRSSLAAFLAGDLDEESAQKRLRNTLNDLRTAVGDHLAVTREWVAFDRERPHWIDVTDLEARVAARDDPPAGDGDGAAPAAFDFYRGEFLSGVELSDAPAFDEWLVLQREHLRLAQVQALQTALQAHVRGGPAAADAGVSVARRLLEVEPWSEDAHRALMTLLARRGQR